MSLNASALYIRWHSNFEVKNSFFICMNEDIIKPYIAPEIDRRDGNFYGHPFPGAEKKPLSFGFYWNDYQICHIFISNNPFPSF